MAFYQLKILLFQGLNYIQYFFSVKNAFENYFYNFDDIEELFIKG